MPVSASPKQIKFIDDLFEERNVWSDPAFFDAHNAMDKGEFDQAIERMKADAAANGKEARKLITWLLSLPKNPKAAGERPGYRPKEQASKPESEVVNRLVDTALKIKAGAQAFTDEELDKLLAALSVYITETDGDIETYDLVNKIRGYLGKSPVQYPSYLL